MVYIYTKNVFLWPMDAHKFGKYLNLKLYSKWHPLSYWFESVKNLSFQTRCQNFGCLSWIIQKLYKFENLTNNIFTSYVCGTSSFFGWFYHEIFARESKYSGEEMCEYMERSSDEPLFLVHFDSSVLCSVDWWILSCIQLGRGLNRS